MRRSNCCKPAFFHVSAVRSLLGFSVHYCAKAPIWYLGSRQNLYGTAEMLSLTLSKDRPIAGFGNHGRLICVVYWTVPSLSMHCARALELFMLIYINPYVERAYLL